MIERERDIPVVVESPAYERHQRRRDIAWLLLGASALIVALTLLVVVLWQMVSSVQATPFDSDGVRCYAKAASMNCIKTAEPPR
jgi:hypothetical protein